MGLTGLLQKAALGAALALGTFSSSGCSSSSPASAYVNYEKKTSNAEGKAAFGEKVIAQLQDEETQSPLENIAVHYLHTEQANTLLAIDPQGNYYPGLATFSSGEQQLERQRRKAKAIVIGLQAFRAGAGAGKVILDTINNDHGNVLGEDENVTRYCMTLDEIVKTTIDIPAGIIFIAPKLVYGDAAEVIKIAGTTTLKEIAEKYIVEEYGLQLGYEVHVPKTAMSICGQEYEEAVCDISGGQLEQLWSSELPYWQIVGGCVPKGGTTEGDPCKPEEGLVFCDDFTGEELDLGKWDVNTDDTDTIREYLPVKEGILEMIVGPGTAILDSRSSYTLGDSTFIFEARWKVREREGTDFDVGLYGGTNLEGGFYFERGYDHNDLRCGNIAAGTTDSKPCDTDISQWHTTRLEASSERVQFYIDNKPVATSNQPTTNNIPLFIQVRCSSGDENQKRCFIDYLKLIIR